MDYADCGKRSGREASAAARLREGGSQRGKGARHPPCAGRLDSHRAIENHRSVWAPGRLSNQG